MVRHRIPRITAVRPGSGVARKCLVAQCISLKIRWHNSCSSASPDFILFASIKTGRDVMAAADALKMIKDNEVKFVDLRFTDTRGKEQHVSVPVSSFSD